MAPWSSVRHRVLKQPCEVGTLTVPHSRAESPSLRDDSRFGGRVGVGHGRSSCAIDFNDDGGGGDGRMACSQDAQPQPGLPQIRQSVQPVY